MTAGAIAFCSNPATWHPTIHVVEDHHHPPKAWRVLLVAASWWRVIPLCGLCHSEYHTLLNRYVRLGGPPPYEERRRYQTYIQHLVAEAWANRPAGKLPYTLTEPFGPQPEENAMTEVNVNEAPETPGPDNGAVQVVDPQGDVTVQQGGQEDASQAPGGQPTGTDEAK